MIRGNPENVFMENSGKSSKYTCYPYLSEALLVLSETSGLANENEAVNVPLPEDDNEDLEEKMYTQENIDVSFIYDWPHSIYHTTQKL